MKTFFKQHAALLCALAAIAVLCFLPVLNAKMVIGEHWRGVPQNYGDEILYVNHITEIATGSWTDGNPYLYEHRHDLPLVLFTGNWIAAIPLALGVPLSAALILNFIIWSLVFVYLAYKMVREFECPPWLAAAAALAAHLSIYGLMLRPSNRQEVFPVFLFFYWAVIRFLKYPERASSLWLLGISTGLCFWVFSYLWQLAVVTLGFLALYLLYRREWFMLKRTLLASFVGGLIGLPTLLYMAYQWFSSPYFMESLSRFGLVETHLPMGEVFREGAWVAALLGVIAFVVWRRASLRTDTKFFLISFFAALTGLALVTLMGSNVITGKLLETPEHIKPFIGPWYVLASVVLGYYVYRVRAFVVLAILVVIAIAHTHLFVLTYLKNYISPTSEQRVLWREEQSYAAPLVWLEKNVQYPSVVWTDPQHPISLYVPALTKQYVLYGQGAMWTLTSNEEIQERYLVASYFASTSRETLVQNLDWFVGRQDAFHTAKTVEREIKICRLLHLRAECGPVPTSADLLGDAFFDDLLRKLNTDIRPHVSDYLRKYHVSYILKDTKLNAGWRPETLGARLVWSDDRFEIYKLP
jgi:hypothetical protein